ncbi:MAG: hypothetical protein QOD74_774 [Variibacter sp.]|nr:hypothetical protein [Variibacter sp.]
MIDPRKIDRGLVVSAVAHVLVLGWTAVSFGAKPIEKPPQDSVFVDTISDAEFSKMMKGAKTAPKKETPKPLVEKVAEQPKQVESLEAKVAEKELVTASAASAAPPPPPPPRPEKKEPEKAKAEPEKKLPEAEALKKDEKKKEKPEPKKEEAKPVPPKKPEPKPVQQAKPDQEQSKFDANRIAALLDKRQPQRLAAVGDNLNSLPTLGTSTGTSAKLTQNEIDALRARIQQCWNPPAGQADAKDLIVQVRIRFNQDGSLSVPPSVVNSGNGAYARAASESATRAVVRCAPYTFLPLSKYDSWKDVEVTFDPRDLFRG